MINQGSYKRFLLIVCLSAFGSILPPSSLPLLTACHGVPSVRQSISPKLSPPVRLYPVQSLCHALCLPLACPVPTRPCILPKPNRPSGGGGPSGPYPFDRLSDWEKHSKQLAHGTGPGKGRDGRGADFTLLLCHRLNISGSAGNNYRATRDTGLREETMS